MSLIKFERLLSPAGSVQFSRVPAYGDYERQTKYLQPRDFADDGTPYSYYKGLQQFRTLTFKNIPASDLTNFMTFLNTVAIGMSNSFTFYDSDGTTYTKAWIWNSDDIRSKPIAYNRESLTVVLLVQP